MEPKLLLEKELEPIFLEKFPTFPDNIKEGIVEYGPYVLLVLSVISLFGLFTALGVGTVAIGLSGMPPGTGFSFYISVISAIITVVLYLMAFSPLRARKKAGWNLLYYALLINLLSNLILLHLFGVIISGLIGFWVLFQIREKYIL